MSDRATASRKFRVSLLIFLSVNAALLLAWAAVTAAGIQLHSRLWPWPVVMAVWALRLAMEARSVRRPNTYSEDQIQREMDRLR